MSTTVSDSQNSAGSYAFGSFDGNDSELSRLMHQAEIVKARELSLLENAGLKDNMNILDLACGPGVVSSFLAEFAADGHVTGVDLSNELLDVARSYTKKKGIANIEFQQGDVYQLALQESSYDFIYARFLFQHLQDPQKALAKMIPLLKPGGVICILDIDDGWLSIYPEPEGFRSFTQRAEKGQNSYGGDRRVGRKLAPYLNNAGLAEVNVHVETFNSQQLGMKNFIDITTGFKREQVPKDELIQADEELKTIYQSLNKPDAWGYAACFVATGQRP